MHVNLLLQVETPPGATTDPSPAAWTAGYVTGSLLHSGLVVVGCTPADREPHSAPEPEHDESGLDLGHGLREALANATDAMRSIEQHDGKLDDDPQPFHEALVDHHRSERLTSEPITRVPFDPERTRARALSGTNDETV